MINFKINLMMRWMDLIRHVLSIVHKKNRPGDAWRSKLPWHRAVAGNPERDSVSL